MTRPLNVAMLGATGRMGRTIVPMLAADASGLRLSGALAASGDTVLGQDAGVQAGTAPLAVAVTDQPARALEGADVAIDFSLADASLRHAAACRERNCPLVIGTTGHSDAQRAELVELARGLPIVLAPNMSLGVNVMFKLAELAARALAAAQYDAEIVEAHHRHKVDAPSGTALELGRAVAQGRGVDLDQVALEALVLVEDLVRDLLRAAAEHGPALGAHDVEVGPAEGGHPPPTQHGRHVRRVVGVEVVGGALAGPCDVQMGVDADARRRPAGLLRRPLVQPGQRGEALGGTADDADHHRQAQPPRAQR